MTRDMRHKEWWLDAAEVIDAFRVFPRAFLVLSFCAFFWLMVRTWDWYTALDYASLGVAQIGFVTAFPVSLLTAVSTMFYKLYDKYSTTGRDWNQRPEGSALPRE